MVTRRAMIDLTNMFQKPIGISIGDYVAMVGNPGHHQVGKVVSIDPVIRKVWVAWTAEENIVQHDIADVVKVINTVASVGRRMRYESIVSSTNYKGYSIEKSGDNFYVKDPKGSRAFGEVPASIETAKKWIDLEIAEKLNHKKASEKTAKDISALEMYSEFRKQGKSPDQAAEACMDVLTGGAWSAMDETAIANYKRGVINKFEHLYKSGKKAEILSNIGHDPDCHCPECKCVSKLAGADPKNTHNYIMREQNPSRRCNSNDLIDVAEGLQCGNCGALSRDHGKTWENAHKGKKLASECRRFKSSIQTLDKLP